MTSAVFSARAVVDACNVEIVAQRQAISEITQKAIAHFMTYRTGWFWARRNLTSDEALNAWSRDTWNVDGFDIGWRYNKIQQLKKLRAFAEVVPAGHDEITLTAEDANMISL